MDTEPIDAASRVLLPERPKLLPAVDVFKFVTGGGGGGNIGGGGRLTIDGGPA